MSADGRQARGWALLDEIDPISGEAVFAARHGVTSGSAQGDIRQRHDLRRRTDATRAGPTTPGYARRALTRHGRNAPNLGPSASGRVESLLHKPIHAGFPAAINAILTARELFAGQGLHPLEET